MRTYEIGKNVFVKLDVDLDEVDRFLEKFGLKIHWLLQDGVIFEYPETITTKNYPGDISFYDTKTNALILTYIENFGNLEFIRDDEVIFSMPTMECEEYIKPDKYNS